MTEDELHNKMAVLLGGRAAERLIFGKVSTGAADDLAKASDIARSAAAQFGMVPSLGDVAYDRIHQQFLQGAPQPGGWLERSYAEQTAREIDCAVREMVSQAADRAFAELEKRRDVLERGAKLLLEKERLAGADLARLLNGRKTKSLTEATPAPDSAAFVPGDRTVSPSSRCVGRSTGSAWGGGGS